MRFAKYALVLTAGLLLVGAAAAQQQRQQPRPGQPGGGFGGFGGGFGGGLTFMLGQSKELQEELKLSKEQVEEVTAALTKVREEMRDETAKLRDRNISQGEREEITKKVAEANNKALSSVLKPDQLKRFRQIENQQAGMGMFSKEEVQKALKLSDDQKEKIDTITKDLQRDLRELFAGGAGGAGRGRPDPEAAKKREGLQQEANEGILRVLNNDQKETLKDLKGEPFELPRPNFGGAPGGTPGGFGGFGGGGQPGQILSQAAQGTLRLTDDQKKELEAIQKEVDARLEKVLTEEQRTQLKEMRERGGRGGPGGAPGTPGTGRPGTGNRPGRPNNPNPNN